MMNFRDIFFLNFIKNNKKLFFHLIYYAPSLHLKVLMLMLAYAHLTKKKKGACAEFTIVYTNYISNSSLYFFS